MKILVTGAKGQLGYYLIKAFSNTEHHLYLTDKDTMNITNFEQTSSIVNEVQPDIVIHSAAYTNVDGCETNGDLAFKVNALGTRNLAIACSESKAKMLYISTDFVFDGNKKTPYSEYDQTNPLSVYGKSKLAGEEYVKVILNRFFIVRTSWIYGSDGNNFVKTIQRLAKEKDTLDVVCDQTGSPTFAGDLAQVIVNLIKTDYYGTYHCSNEGECSWYEFAKKIIALSKATTVQVKPISSRELNRPAQRPTYSVLQNYMLDLHDMNTMPHWEDALQNFYNERGN